MTKKLPANDIANELAGSSAFFQPQAPSKPAHRSPEADNKPISATQTAETIPSPHTSPNQSSSQDIMTPRHRDTTIVNHHDSKQPFNEDAMMAEHFDDIRKVVKQLGKEVSTHRFTAEEKAELADIVYTYARQGLRTSENEITRIGLNWLLLDYRQNGANSVLSRLLERLHS